MTKTTNALSLTGNAALPAHLAAMGAIGNENMNSQTLATPRLGLLQQLSPQVTKGKAEFIAGATPGQFFNSLSGEVMESLYVSNLFMQMGFTAFKKRALGKDFQGNHPTIDAAVAHLQNQGLNPLDYDIDENHTHTLAVIDEINGVVKSPILFSLKRSGLGVSRGWNTQIVTLNANVPRFASIWKLEGTLVNGTKGSYYQPHVGFAGWAPAALADELRDIYTALHGQVPLAQDADL